MRKIGRIGAVMIAVFLSGCTAAPPPPASEIARLTGGYTKVVAFGFCVPMDRLIKTTIYRADLTYFVNGKAVGKMKSCGHATFRVPSGYWKSQFSAGGLNFPHRVLATKFFPGKTQYLHMRPSGNSTFTGYWVSAAEAKKHIAEIKTINQIF